MNLQIFFVFALLYLPAASAQICQGIFNPQFDARMIDTGLLPAFKIWMNERPSFEGEYSPKYKDVEKQQTRWQLLNANTSPHFRQMILSARPEFFKDQIPPTPLQLTWAMIHFFKAHGLPQVDWVLPGVTLVHRWTKKKIFKTYLELEKQWPFLYEISDLPVSEKERAEIFYRGGFPLRWHPQKDERYNIFMFYHDLNHLASLFELPYFHALQKLYRYVYARTQKGADANDLANRLTGKLAYGFIEEFSYIPKRHHREVSTFLRQFRNDRGESLDLRNKYFTIFDLYTYFEGAMDLPQWQRLELEGSQLSKRLYSLNLTPRHSVDQMPKDLQPRYRKLREDYAKLYLRLKPQLENLQFMLSTFPIEVGAARGDFFSRRAARYRLEFPLEKWFDDIEYGFFEGLDWFGYYDPAHFQRNFAELLSTLITWSNDTAEIKVEEILKEADAIY